MTVTETNAPAHVVQALATALASAGIAALTTVYVFIYPPLTFVESLISVDRHLPAILALAGTLTIATVTATPALRRAGGWPAPLTGLLAMLACYWVIDAQPELGRASQVPLMVAHGVALGGVLAVAALGGLHQRIAIAIGVAFGLTTGVASIRLLSGEYRAGQNPALYAAVPVIAIAILAAIAAVMASRLPAPEPVVDQPQRRELLIPSILAAVLYVLVLVGDQSIMDNSALSQYYGIGLALLVGLIVIWYGYRDGKAETARWLIVCFALAGPAAASVLNFHYARPGTGTSLVLVAIAAAAGGMLARHVAGDLPWEVIGIAMAAFGLILSSVANRIGPDPGFLIVTLVSGGVAFALGSGLAALLSSTAHPATALSLGLVTLVLTAYAMRPATLLILMPRDSNDVRLAVPMVSLLAAAAILALRRFSAHTYVSAESTANTVRMTDL